MSEPGPLAEHEGLAFDPICDLGRGGMGTVRLARLRGPDQFARLFVLKRLREDRRDLETAQRFAYEGRIASSIRHANVVQTHHVGRDEQGLFLVIEYVEGASLEQLLAALARESEPLPAPVALRIALDALAGLGAVHEARDLTGAALGVLHRDVTLQNLLIGVDGLTRLADFGIAKAKHSPVVTDQAYVVGKLRFLAPEYVRREPVTQSIDVYSLGVSLWHALTGQVLWRQANEAELVEHVLLDSVPPVSTYVEVAPALEAIVARACARVPQQRYATARAMTRAIEESGMLVASHTDVGELVQRLFARELAERRRQIAAITSRSARFEPKAYPQNVSPLLRQSRSAATRTRRRRVAWLSAGFAVTVMGAVFATLAVRAGATAEPASTSHVVSRAAPPVAPAAPAKEPVTAPPSALATSAAAGPPAIDRAAPAQRRKTVVAPDALVKRNPYRD